MKKYILFFVFLCCINTLFSQCPPEILHAFHFDEATGNEAENAVGTNPVLLENITWTTGKINSAVNFNGIDSRSNLNETSFDWTPTSSFTIEFWFRLNSVNLSQNMVFIGRDDPSTPLHWWIGLESPDSRPTFVLRDVNGVISILTADTVLSTGVWYHLAAVRDNGSDQNRIYLNGELIGEASVNYTGAFTTAKPVGLGHMNFNNSNSFWSHVDLDELYVFSTALSESTILNHYNEQNSGTMMCPLSPSESIKIMPLGNSITFDVYSGDVRPDADRVAYRMSLYNLLIAAGYDFDFIGSETAGQNLFPDPENAGFPGMNTSQLVQLLNTGVYTRTGYEAAPGPYFDYYVPDVILLHIGTNDLTTDVSWLDDFLDILDDLRASSGKNIKLLLAKIINRVAYSSTTTQYNQNLEAAFLARPHPDNYLVDMENGAGIIYSSEMIDNLHPNSAGYTKMAENWYSHLTYILPSPSPDLISAPSDLSLTASPGTVDLNWTDNSFNETGFRIERSLQNGTGYITIHTTADNIENYEDTDVTGGITYYYRITALNSTDISPRSEQRSVTAIGSASIINVAPGKPVTQSGTWYGGVPERAIDGSTNGVFSQGSVSHTANTLNPWWQIDLQSIYSISSIEVWNRTDCCLGRLSDWHVFVSDVPFTSQDLTTTINQAGVWNQHLTTFPNPTQIVLPGRTGRYVRIQISGQNELNMAEVRINASVTPPSIPEPPSGLEANTVSSSEISLSWSDNSTNEDGFKIERSQGDAFSEIAQTGANVNTFNNSGLSPSIEYTYRVRAFNATGNSAYSNEAEATTSGGGTTPVNVAPGKPVTQSGTWYGGVPERAIDGSTNGVFSQGSVSHTANALNPWWQIDLQSIYSISSIEVWNRTDCCLGRLSDWHVFVSDVPFTSQDLTTTINQAGVWNQHLTTFPNPTQIVLPGRTGRYVRIQISGQNELNMAEVRINASVTPPSIPEPPSGLEANTVSSSEISLSWSDNSTNEDGFKIERSQGDAFSEIAQTGANVNTLNNSGLLSSTQYTYRVRAFNAGGNSAYSNEASATTSAAPVTPNAPSLLAANTVSSSEISLSWSDNSTDEDGFKIERSQGGAFSEIAQTGANVNTFNNSGLLSSTQYTYRVRAFNAGGNSAYSNEASATTSAGGSTVNVAPAKPVTQSGTWYGGVPERAIDGSTNGVFSQGSVSHTANTLNPWWQIDLQSIYSISSIEVWNRTDCCLGRLSDWHVFVSDVPFTSQDLTTTINQAGVWNQHLTTFPNPTQIVLPGRTGRYVRIQISGQNELNMAEVKVNAPSGTKDAVTIPYARNSERFSVYPNPADEQITIRYLVENNSRITVVLYKIDGTLMEKLADEYKSEGEYTDVFDLHNRIAPGIYMIRFISDEQNFIQKLIINK